MSTLHEDLKHLANELTLFAHHPDRVQSIANRLYGHAEQVRCLEAHVVPEAARVDLETADVVDLRPLLAARRLHTVGHHPGPGSAA